MLRLQTQGSMGSVFEHNNQIIKIMKLNRYPPDTDSEFTSLANRQQFAWFQKVEQLQKQGVKTPGIPEIYSTTEGRWNPQLKMAFPNTPLATNDLYGMVYMEKIPIVAPDDRVSNRRGLADFLRFNYKLGYYVRDLSLYNKGLRNNNTVVWFDPVVAPVNPSNEEEQRAREVLFDWGENVATDYNKAIANNKYFKYEHIYGLFYSEEESENYWLRGGCGKAAKKISKKLKSKGVPHHFEVGLAYLDGRFVGNHIVVIVNGQDGDNYSSYGAKKRWEMMMAQDWGFEEFALAGILDTVMDIVWIPVEEDFSIPIDTDPDYYPRTGGTITPKTLGFNSESAEKIQSDTPENWTTVTIANPRTDSFGYAYQRRFDFRNWDGNPYNAVWELMELCDDLNLKLRHTAHVEWSYDQVKITLYTDDVGNITTKDFIWAEEFNDIYDDEEYDAEMITMKPKRKMVIMTQGNKVTKIIKWDYYPDGSKTYEEVPIPKPVTNSNADLVRRYYTTLGIASYIYNEDNNRFSAESYPRCYLCGFPAKIEVLTAVGMRNFCGNKCRGEYEGVDYGDYDSPKLEHQLTITKYDPGYLPDRYEGQESKLTIDCANCSLHLTEDIPQYTDLYSEYRRGQNYTIKTWNEEWEDYDEEPCFNHDLKITRHLSNSESYDGVNLGEIAFRCLKCGYRDMIYADIPEGCSNTGRDKPSMSLYQNKS